tara:strand:- start:322 stop:579 length:258 start_codon:yes stop_codon:yes gene_type:complete
MANMGEDDDGYIRRPGRDNPIYEMATGLSDLQFSILQELYNRPQSMKGKPFYKRDESGQYYFDFAHGGKIHRGRRAGKSAEKKDG